MLELDGLFSFLLLGLWLFCIFEVITTPESEMRNLPKGAWLFIVVLLIDIGSIMWLLAGRRKGPGNSAVPYKGNTGQAPVRRSSGSAGRSLAPDDDPEFLAQLKKSNNEHESMLNQWEADLRRREQDLRKPGDDVPPDAQPSS